MALECKKALELMAALGAANEQLRAMCSALRFHRKVKGVDQLLEIRASSDGWYLHGYVDIELSNGDGVGWSIYARHDGLNWVTDVSVEINRKGRDEQETLREWPEWESPTVDGFIQSLKDAVLELEGDCQHRMDLPRFRNSVKSFVSKHKD